MEILTRTPERTWLMQGSAPRGPRREGRPTVLKSSARDARERYEAAKKTVLAATLQPIQCIDIDQVRGQLSIADRRADYALLGEIIECLKAGRAAIGAGSGDLPSSGT